MRKTVVTILIIIGLCGLVMGAVTIGDRVGQIGTGDYKLVEIVDINGASIGDGKILRTDVNDIVGDANQYYYAGGPDVNVSDIHTAAVANGNDTNVPTCDGVYDFVYGLSYLWGILQDLNDLGTCTDVNQLLVSTAAGVFAWESGNTARTSLGLGTGDTPAFAGLNIDGGDIVCTKILPNGEFAILSLCNYLGTPLLTVGYGGGVYPTGVRFNTAAIPSADASYDLGYLEGNRWRNLYLSGNLSDETNTLTVANCKTAYDHSQDNTQAHSDYLINNGDDSTTGRLSVVNDVNALSYTIGANTLDTSEFAYLDGIDQDVSTDANVTHNNITSTGIIKAADGSATAPFYTFTLDPDTGIYRSGTNAINFACGGTEYLQLKNIGFTSYVTSFSFYKYSDTPAICNIFTFSKARGTRAIPTATQSGDTLGVFRMLGYTGGIVDGVQIKGVATENYAPAPSLACGAKMDFYTLPNSDGTGTPIKQMTIEQNGSVTMLGALNFGTDAGGTDTYAITLPTAPTAYTNGMKITFDPNTANTDACTLNVNALGAKSLKVFHDKDPNDNYIEAHYQIMCTYSLSEDVFQIQTPSAN